MINDQNQEPTEELEEGQEVEELEDIPEVEDGEEDTTDWKAIALKNQGIAKRLKTKLDKEPQIKTSVVDKQEIGDTVKGQDESFKDNYALIKNDVHEEDVQEVLDYANYKKISISEALKSNLVKTLLSERVEQRKTAEATNTGVSKRGSVKIPDSALLDKAIKTQEVPETDEAMEKLVNARMEAKRNK